MRLVSVLFLLLPLATFTMAATFNVDGQSPGRTFEGIGALSAGASSRLLLDYPEPQRSQILDFLFKPAFGAALPHLKVEIGGDVNSTDGTEPSHARTREEFEQPRRAYFERGYEWWLMREAKRRNRRILLDGLQWGAPGWIGEALEPTLRQQGLNQNQINSRKFFTQDNADFIAAFILGGHKYHRLTLDYCGVWNETPHDPAWIKLLRTTLDRHQLTQVRVVAADRNDADKWGIAGEMLADPALMHAVSVIGAHYVKNQSTPDALKTGKPVWCSEEGFWYGSTEPWPAAAHLAKIYNRQYIEGRMTKTIVWSLVSSYYDTLPLPGSGLMEATQPWSGHFEVRPALWITAHTTQFAPPGWRYLDDACTLLPGGGSLVTLRSPPPRSDYSIIVETIDAREPQTLTFRIRGGLATSPLHVWRSQPHRQFERLPPLPVREASVTFVAEPNSVYSLTTTTGQRQGHVKSVPPPQSFPLPYTDDFESSSPGKYARYFSDQGGVFEVTRRTDGPGLALRQTIARTNIDWHYHPTPEPYTLIGSPQWRNYEVRCEARIEQAGSVSLWGHIVASLQNADPAKGIWLNVDSDGHWKLNAYKRTLAQGQIPFPANQWHQLRLRFLGHQATAWVNEQPLATVPCGFYRRGQAGLGTGWNHAQFDNFAVRPLEGPGLPDPVNFARTATVSASSAWNSDHVARFATDGNSQTRWNAARGDLAGAWLALEFPTPTRFDTVLIRPSGQRIASFRLQARDDLDWRDLAVGEPPGDNEWELSFPTTTARQLRLLITRVTGDHPENSTPSIQEIEVYLAVEAPP